MSSCVYSFTKPSQPVAHWLGILAYVGLSKSPSFCEPKQGARTFSLKPWYTAMVEPSGQSISVYPSTCGRCLVAWTGKNFYSFFWSCPRLALTHLILLPLKTNWHYCLKYVKCFSSSGDGYLISPEIREFLWHGFSNLRASHAFEIEVMLSIGMNSHFMYHGSLLGKCWIPLPQFGTLQFYKYAWLRLQFCDCTTWYPFKRMCSYI